MFFFIVLAPSAPAIREARDGARDCLLTSQVFDISRDLHITVSLRKCTSCKISHPGPLIAAVKYQNRHYGVTLNFVTGNTLWRRRTNWNCPISKATLPRRLTQLSEAGRIVLLRTHRVLDHHVIEDCRFEESCAF